MTRSSVIKPYQSSPVLGGSVVPQTLLCSDGLMAGSSVGGSCGYHNFFFLKCSEQNHNPKEKGFKLKEYSRLKSHDRFLNTSPKQAITFVLALRPIGAVAWESPSQLTTIV